MPEKTLPPERTHEKYQRLLDSCRLLAPTPTAVAHRTARRVSHCFVMDVPTHAEPLIVTDATVNIAPTLEDLWRPLPA